MPTVNSELYTSMLINLFSKNMNNGIVPVVVSVQSPSCSSPNPSAGYFQGALTISQQTSGNQRAISLNIGSGISPPSVFTTSEIFIFYQYSGGCSIIFDIKLNGNYVFTPGWNSDLVMTYTYTYYTTI